MDKFVIVVPALNPGEAWQSWVDSLCQQTTKPARVIIMDSGSTDTSLEISVREGYEIHVLKKSDFNHGGTRQLALSKFRDEEVAVYMTQDATLADKQSLERLLKPFSDHRVAAVCGRQLPRKDAGLIETHARLFNYPKVSSRNSIDDAATKGLKAAFLSNSFAAYRVSALQKIGGFPANVIFGEDMYVATKLLKAGYEVAYAAEASVYHSHGYSLWQEMERYFDMGVFHAREPWIRQELGGAEGEGLRFVISELKYVLNYEFWRVPEVLLRTLLRYTGFRLGLLEKYLPRWLKSWLAMNKGYFKR